MKLIESQREHGPPKSRPIIQITRHPGFPNKYALALSTMVNTIFLLAELRGSNPESNVSSAFLK